MKHVFLITVQQLFLSNQYQKLFLKENSKYLLWFIFLFSTVFYGCSDSKSDDFELIQTDTQFDFHCIVEYEDNLYASGGDVWTRSDLLISKNGIEWIKDSLTNKSIFDLYTDSEILYGVGNDGYIFSGQPDLILSRTKYWGLLQSIISNGNGFITTGGKDFNKGWIFKVNPALQVDTAHYFENEIVDVSCNSTGKCIACGYGIILSSSDQGISWQRSDENGDFYSSIAINNKDEFFIVGYNGTIIKSSDDGDSWFKLKNGHSPLTNNKPFRTIKFKDNIGVISGDNGLIWISKNGGDDWEDISIDTDLDIFDFTFYNTEIVGVSEAGQIVILSI